MIIFITLLVGECKDERLIDDAAPASDDEIGRLLGGIELGPHKCDVSTMEANNWSLTRHFGKVLYQYHYY